MLFQLKRNLTPMKKVNTLSFFVCFILICLISLGYSALSQNLMIAGDIIYLRNQYGVIFNKNASDATGIMDTQVMTYGQEEALHPNEFVREGYIFTGWSTSSSDTNIIYDSSEYTGVMGDGASDASEYVDFKQYTINAPFAEGEVYQLEVDVKGSGLMVNYFWGASGYLQVAHTENLTTGYSTDSRTDGGNPYTPMSDYKHHTVRFTLGSTGDGNINKYLLFRVYPNSNITIKNVRFYKVSSSSRAYVDTQIVKNLVPSGEINLYAIWKSAIWNYNYTGNQQVLTVPYDGIYKLEVWGAQGGGVSVNNYNATGGYGAYSVGSIYLNANETIYINVGQSGSSNTGYRYNGGGSSGMNNGHASCYSASGGGTTHMAKASGQLKDLESYKGTLYNNSYYLSNTILIAAGGGGAGSVYDWNGNRVGNGGNGGGIIGNNGTGFTTKAGGTQTSGSAFGRGIDGSACSAAPGGGFYGGNKGDTIDGTGTVGAGGGSGYIGNSSLFSKHMTCYNCTTSDDANTKTISNTNVSATATPEYSKTGNGYARITYVQTNSYLVTVTSIDASRGTVTPTSVRVDKGSSADITLIPASGYKYYSNTCGGTVSNNVLTIPDVDENITCTVRFVTSKNFDYTGGEQTFTTLEDGLYKLEVWGAQGGSSSAQSINGGYGGYSTGAIVLSQGTTLYINVGGAGSDGTSGTTINGGYNGGGNGYYAANGRGSGGGASSVSTASGTLYNLGQNNNQGDVVIVAGGGGGYGYYSSTQYGAGGNGGGIQGNDGDNNYSGDAGAYVAAYGGTQSVGGSGVAVGLFGKGADAIQTYNSNAWGGAGGGGGYYGGGAAHNNSGGGGGSGYIGNSLLSDKHMTCYNCTTSDEENTKTISNTNVSETATADYSKTGNGYARITFIQEFNLSAIYTITYNNNGGEGCDSTSANALQEWGSLCIPSRENYGFKEWNTKQDGTGTTITSNMIAMGDLIAYAIWIPSHTLIYNTVGGSACNPSTKTGLEGLAWDDLCSTSKEGYTFEGWNTEQNGTGTTITADSIISTDLTVYAQWQEIVTEQWNYNYTGSYQTFAAPYTGEYRVELWGGQGTANNNAGKGAYTYGNIFLNRGENLYVYVGGGGSNRWNGGGSATNHCGGGATDVRLVSGSWNNATSLRSRIMVAGGSGGIGLTYRWGGNAGLTSGSKGYDHSKSDDCETITVTGGAGGTQTTGNAFGVGANGNTDGGGAGGGGYWGGKAGGYRYLGTDCTSTGIVAGAGGGGGSSYISGVTGYIAVASSSSNSPRKASDNTTTCTQTIANSDNTCSIHYSGKKFILAGGSGGNRTGNGQAIITFLNTFTITYNNNGGNGCTTLTQDHDVAWGTQCLPTREGYTFAEWNTKQDGTGTTIFGTELARSNLTLYAIWQSSGPEWNYSYTKTRKAFRVPATGTYKIELWGAAGGGATTYGGYGAYVYGNINLTEGEMLYVHVGGQAKWNGGGGSKNSGHYGGDATDIRLPADNLYSRIMVAAGGGGVGETYKWGGKGGLISGATGTSHTTSDDCHTLTANGGAGGTQTTGNAFGVGASDNTVGGGAGGGGYWGGKQGVAKYQNSECTSTGLAVASGGGGGSSFISGATGYIAITANGNTTPRNDSNGVQCTSTSAVSDITCSIHYSGKIFTNYGGTSGARSGTGAAKITFIG